MKCPKEGCDKECKNEHSLATHWGKSHEGPIPDHIDTSFSESHKEALSEAMQGKERSSEHSQALSEALMGRELSEEHVEAISEGLSGREFSEEHREAISEARKGESLSEEHVESIRKSLMGRELSEEHREAVSKSVPRGEDHWMYRDNSDYKEVLNTRDRIEIRIAFRERCQMKGCNKRRSGPRKPLEVAHIDENPENNDPGNLTLLCTACHRQLDFMGAEPSDIERTLADVIDNAE